MPILGRLGRWSLAVLASAWFFPVSCTTALGVGTEVATVLDERDAARGDKVHGNIAVVALPADKEGEAFGYMLLNNVEYNRKGRPETTFLMPAKEGSLKREEYIEVSYKVVSGAAGEQVIETEYRDSDRAAWGRYRATKDGVVPLASRLLESWYMFQAMPYALVFALVVYFGAGFAKRRLQKAAA